MVFSVDWGKSLQYSPLNSSALTLHINLTKHICAPDSFKSFISLSYWHDFAVF